MAERQTDWEKVAQLIATLEDLVNTTLAQLVEENAQLRQENNDLRQRLEACEQRQV
jgi:regulator of replication initiation timing